MSTRDPASDRTADSDAIASLVQSYARAADRRDFDALVELFTADGTLAMHDGDPERTEPRRVRHGRTEIAQALELLRGYAATHHMLGQHSVQFDSRDADRASGETYCLASHTRDDGGHMTMRMMAIRYFDDFVRDGGTWRIERRRLAVDWIDEHPMG